MNANINALTEAVTSGFALVHAESANNSIRIMNRFVIAQSDLYKKRYASTVLSCY